MNKELFLLSSDVVSPGVSLIPTTIPSIKKLKNKTPWESDIPILDLNRANIRSLTVTRLPGFLVPGSWLTKKPKKLKKRGR